MTLLRTLDYRYAEPRKKFLRLKTGERKLADVACVFYSAGLVCEDLARPTVATAHIRKSWSIVDSVCGEDVAVPNGCAKELH